jgi:leucyl-tRNA synthetase
MVLLLAPIVPHICHSLWRELGNDGALVDARWPQVDARALRRSTIELVVQINGKVRGKIEVAADASSDAIIEFALAQPNVQKFIDGKAIAMSKVVPGKLVTFAVK